MLDIYSKGNYPSCALSNFASHPFVLDEIEIHSMEGFLQSLKYKNAGKQKKVCMLSGKHAKEAGKKKILWRITRNVYWKGRKIHLLSDELQLLVDRAYHEMFLQSEEFRQALLDADEELLTHTIGRKSMEQTILTEYHFVRRLEYLKMELRIIGKRTDCGED